MPTTWQRRACVADERESYPVFFLHVDYRSYVTYFEGGEGSLATEGHRSVLGPFCAIPEVKFYDGPYEEYLVREIPAPHLGTTGGPSASSSAVTAC